ncbi:hypothetical protein [Methanoculleus sp.]|uniref:hypothetical protein n=1 Tax=Methanoculleus sp. TaxID=90427 RepID=UPI001BD3E6C7|nr:hypothetical protein [Methanoculleus sp.]
MRPPVFTALAGDLGASMLVYLCFNKPVFINPIALTAALAVIILGIALDIKGWMPGPIDAKIVSKKVIFVLILVATALLAYTVLAPWLFPPFAITVPRNNVVVDQMTAVYGHGAIPGASVEVWVTDEYGQKWSQGVVHSRQDGSWECPSVQIGQKQGQSHGETYLISADLTLSDGTIYPSNLVPVKRS